MNILCICLTAVLEQLYLKLHMMLYLSGNIWLYILNIVSCLLSVVLFCLHLTKNEVYA